MAAFDVSLSASGDATGGSPSLLSSDCSLISLAADETYASLKRILLSEYKGRPPAFPEVHLTNRLLLQFHLLQTEGNKTRKDVETWFERMFPAKSFPSSRLSGVLDRLLKTIRTFQKEGADLDSFLDTNIDFDFVSVSLMKMGLNRKQLLEDPASLQLQSREVVTHELVQDLEHFRVKEKLPARFTARWLRTLAGVADSDDTLKKSVKQIMVCLRKLRKNKNTEAGNAMCSLFLTTPFKVLPPTTGHTSSPPSSTETSPQQAAECHSKSPTTCSTLLPVSDTNDLKFLEQISSLESQVAVLKETVDDLSLDKKQLNGEVEKVRSQQEKINHLNGVVMKQRQQIKQLHPDRLRHKKNVLQEMRHSVRAARATGKKLDKAITEIRRLKKAAKTCRESNLRSARRARQKIQKHQEDIQLLHEENISLKEEQASLEETSNPHLKLKTKENNRFSDDVRKTVMQLQADGNVPASKCNQVIRIVANQLFGKQYVEKDLPCLQTAVNMADEGHVLAKVQAVEKMLEANNYTLHTDGTSRDGQKIIGTQVTLDSGDTLSLGLYTVPSENASTLLDATVSLFQEIADLYSEDMEEEKKTIFKGLLSRLTSIMTDRAAVMKKFDSEVNNYIQSQLDQEHTVHYLHCNAHFLLGLSRACEIGLKMKEQDMTAENALRLGRDKLSKFKSFSQTEAATSRVIRMTSAVIGPRGDAKNGCRQEWLAYCEEVGVSSQLISFKSNRFNCFFQSAAAIIHHHQDLKAFFSQGFLTHSNMKIESVAADLEDNMLLILVCAVALMYLRVSGPYWLLLESDVEYAQFHEYVQVMMQHFDRWRCNSHELLDEQFPGIFGERFEVESSMKASVYQFARQHQEVQAVLEYIMREIVIVTKSQLCDFLADGKYGQQLSPTMQETMHHCPLTNLMGENVFGEMDFDMNKKRQVSLHHISSTQMMDHNDTNAWLNMKSKDQSALLMKNARKKSRQLRKQHRRQEQLVRLKIREKLLENRQKKLQKQADAAQKKADIIRAVTAHGGPCQLRGDVTKLVARIRQRNKTKGATISALKQEIRFIKTVLGKGKNLKMAGSIEVLKEVLQNYLSLQEPQEREPADSTADESSSTNPKATLPTPTLSIADTDSDTDIPESINVTNQTATEPANNACAEPTDTRFQFTRQGEWLAVYYDDSFYIGQVTDIKGSSKGVVQFLHKAKGRSDYFRWPYVDEAEEIDAYFVFRWNLEVTPVTSDGRVWKVGNVGDIRAAYHRIREPL